MRKLYKFLYYNVLIAILFFVSQSFLFAQTDFIADVTAFSVNKDGQKYVKVNYTLNASTVVLIDKITLTDEFGDITTLQSSDLDGSLEGDIGFVATTGGETKSFKWWFLETLANKKLIGIFKVKVYLKNKPTTPTQVSLTLGSLSNGQYREQTTPVTMKNITGPFTQFTPASGLSSTGNWYNTVESGATFFAGANVSDFPYYNHSSSNFYGKPTLPSGSTFIAIKDISETTRMVWVCLAAGKMQGISGSQKLWDFQIHFNGLDQGTSAATIGVAKDNSPDLDNSSTCNPSIQITYVQPKTVTSNEISIEKKLGFEISVVPAYDYKKNPVHPGGEIQFNITVKEPDGNGGLPPSSGATVYLKNGIANDAQFNALTTLTDANGQLTYKYKIPDNTGSYSFSLKFNAYKIGSPYDKSGTDNQIVFVETVADLSIAVNPQRLKLKPEEKKDVSVVVTDADGPVKMAYVTYTNDVTEPGKMLNLGSTDDQGKILLSVEVPKDKPEGSYDISFYAARGTDLAKKSGPAVCKVIVGVLPELVMTFDPGKSFKLQPTETKKIKILITDKLTNLPVADAEVWVYDPLNSDTKFNLIGKTDADGYRNYDIIVKDGTKEKDYYIQIYAKKDKFIDAETTNVKVTVSTNPCWLQGGLEFCAEGGWKTDPKLPIYKSTSKVTINNLIVFEGSMTIDTVNLGVNATGKFYVPKVPLPGGSEGDLVISEGTFALQLLGSTGKITNFLKSQVKNLNICGVTFELKDLQLVGGRSADGVKLSGSIKVPFLSKYCDSKGAKEDTTGIELTGLIIGMKSGIYLSEGIKITNIGAGPSLCVKEIAVSYDNVKDRLTIGGQLMLPFCDVGGGGAIEKGSLDSLGFMYKSPLPGVGIPLGHPMVCAIGMKGSVFGISNPPFQAKLSAIISDCPTKAVYEATLTVSFKAPSTLGGELEGNMIKIPGFTAWQTKLKGGASYDWTAGIIKLTGEAHAGTLDGASYFLNASGWLAIQVEKSNLVGEVKGDLTIPNIASQGFPWDYLATRIPGGLPVTLGSAKGRFLFTGPTKFIHCDLVLPIKLGGTQNIAIELDFSKGPGQDGFFYYRLNQPPLSLFPQEKNNPNSLLAETNFPFTVPSDINFVVATVKAGGATVPVTKIQKPDGTIVDKTTPDSSIVYSEMKDKSKGFWTLNTPIPGEWKVILIDKSTKDSVIVYSEKFEKSLNLVAKQTGLNVDLTWNGSDFNPGDSIVLGIDDNNTGLDGTDLAKLAASKGKYSFTIPDSLNYCSMFTYALLTENGMIKQSAYASDKILNPKSDLPPPTGINAFYNTANGKTTVYWKPTTAPRVESYYVIVTDKSGKDSVYTGVFSYQSEITMEILDYQNKTITMISVDNKSVGGCQSNPISIITGLEEEYNPTRSEIADLSIVPNPASGFVNIVFKLNEDSNVNLSIFDVLGNKVMDLNKGFYSMGSTSLSFDAGKLQTGYYILRMQTVAGTVAKVLIVN